MKQNNLDNGKNTLLGQSVASGVNHINTIRNEDLTRTLDEISKQMKTDLNKQDINLAKSLQYVENVKKFISNPENILGSQQPKHGEVAEQLEVNIQNARNVLKGFKPKYTFDGVGRTAPEDYINGTQAVQSKFYNGTNKTLKAVLEHHEKYKYFGSDGKSYYVIPKDDYAVIQKIIKGKNVDGLSSKSIDAIKKSIEKFERETGQSFNDVVKPSINDYADVQLGNVKETIKKETNSLKEQSNIKKDKIKQKNDEKKKKAIQNHGPSLKEAAKVTAGATAITAGMSLIMSIGKKVKDGKKLSEFTEDDWKEVGIDTVSGGTKGGISALTTYGLTNFANTPAPLASAYVSAIFGICDLAKELSEGNMTTEEFLKNGELLCIETAISVLGATVGQIIIPIPVLGSVIGCKTASVFNDIAKEYLLEDEQKLIEHYNARLLEEQRNIDSIYQKQVEAIVQKSEQMGELMTIAFDFDINYKLRFETSIIIAKELHVEKNKILRNKQSIDDYFLL